MSWLTDAGQWIGDQIDALTGKAMSDIEQSNYEEQKRHNIAMESFARNTHQIGAEDMMKAGLSKYGMSGGPAKAPNISAPQRGISGKAKQAEFTRDALALPLNVARSVMEIKNIAAQAFKTEQEGQFLNATYDMRMSDMAETIRGKIQSNDYAERTLEERIEQLKNTGKILVNKKTLSFLEKHTASIDYEWKAQFKDYLSTLERKNGVKMSPEILNYLSLELIYNIKKDDKSWFDEKQMPYSNLGIGKVFGSLGSNIGQKAGEGLGKLNLSKIIDSVWNMLIGGAR